MKAAEQVGFYEIEDGDWTTVFSVYEYLQFGALELTHEVGTLYNELHAMYEVQDEVDVEEAAWSEDDEPEYADEDDQLAPEYFLSRQAVHGLIRFLTKKGIWNLEKQTHYGPSAVHYSAVLRHDARLRCIGATAPPVKDVPTSPSDRAPYIKVSKTRACE